MKPSPAARLQLIQELLAPPIYDELDAVIGYEEPLISIDEAKRLLNTDMGDSE